MGPKNITESAVASIVREYFDHFLLFHHQKKIISDLIKSRVWKKTEIKEHKRRKNNVLLIDQEHFSKSVVNILHNYKKYISNEVFLCILKNSLKFLMIYE